MGEALYYKDLEGLIEHAITLEEHYGLVRDIGVFLLILLYDGR